MTKLESENYVVYTGPGGVRNFNRAIEILSLSELLKLIPGEFSEEQVENLIQMLNSNDDRDFELAKTIIQVRNEPNI